MKNMKVNVIENNMVARVNGNPTRETVEKIRKLYGLSQNGNPNKTDRINGNDGYTYKIRPMDDLDDRIYIRFRREDGFWKQITRWYGYFGVAQRHMLRLAGYIQ